MTLYHFQWGGADLAAATSATAAPLLGLADITDVDTIVFPFAVELCGILVEANNASGDTLTGAPTVGGTQQTAFNTQVTHSAKVAQTFYGVGQGVVVPAGTALGVVYATTTGGTYTANDVYIQVWVRTLGTVAV